jgi:hypothetical protein
MALDFCSRVVGRHLSACLARTLGSRCEELTTWTSFPSFYERMSIETFLRPLTLSDFATVGLQEPRGHQDLECYTARTLVFKEGKVSYPGPFVFVLASDIFISSNWYMYRSEIRRQFYCHDRSTTVSPYFPGQYKATSSSSFLDSSMSFCDLP